jgi:hypothetical protein
MFKFGRPNKIYDENLVHDFITGSTFLSGMTMNYVISSDPAMPFNPNIHIVQRQDANRAEHVILTKYATKMVNPNYYGVISHGIRWDDEL